MLLILWLFYTSYYSSMSKGERSSIFLPLELTYSFFTKIKSNKAINNFMTDVLSNCPLKYLFKDLGVQFKDKIKH